MIITKVVATSRYTHPELGPVDIRVMPNSRSIRARWDGETLRVTVPRGLPLDTYEDFIEKNIPRFLEMKPPQYFYLGQVIDAGEVEFRIVRSDFLAKCDGFIVTTIRQNLPPGKVYAVCIGVPPRITDERMNTPAVQTHINKVILKMAAKASHVSYKHLKLPTNREV